MIKQIAKKKTSKKAAKPNTIDVLLYTPYHDGVAYTTGSLKTKKGSDIKWIKVASIEYNANTVEITSAWGAKTILHGVPFQISIY